MKVGIIGGGSIGLLLSYYLARYHQVTLYVRRTGQIKAIQEKGIGLWQDGKVKHRTNISIKPSTDIQADDLLFVCVKQTQLEEVIPRLQAIHPDTTILFLQNGMGHLQRVKDLSHQVMIGVIEHGATRLNDSEVSHLGLGMIKLAPFTMMRDDGRHISTLLHKKDFPFQYTIDYEQLLQEKLIVNAVINPLTAIFDVENGEVLMNEHIHVLAKQLCKETAQILGYNEQKAWQLIEKTAKNTAKNMSSMRADVKEKRQTEIRAISGYLLQIAMDESPYTHFVYHSLLGLEKRGSHDGTVF
jgi:2-dehydropantoate 2-reductase